VTAPAFETGLLFGEVSVAMGNVIEGDSPGSIIRVRVELGVPLREGMKLGSMASLASLVGHGLEVGLVSLMFAMANAAGERILLFPIVLGVACQAKIGCRFGRLQSADGILG
jgi:hypothetical protein